MLTLLGQKLQVIGTTKSGNYVKAIVGEKKIVAPARLIKKSIEPNQKQMLSLDELKNKWNRSN